MTAARAHHRAPLGGPMVMRCRPRVDRVATQRVTSPPAARIRCPLADLPWVTYVVLFPLRDTVLSVVPAAGPVLLALVGLNCWWWVRIARMIARGGRRAERPPPVARGHDPTPDKLD